jgi:hypothetical protein
VFTFISSNGELNIMGENELRISQPEYEEICRSCCDLSPADARGVSPDYFWCKIYIKVCNHVGHEGVSTHGKPYDMESCQKDLKVLVEHRWLERFSDDVLVIASKYIDDVLARGKNYVD